MASKQRKISTINDIPVDERPEEVKGYVPPKQVSMSELINKDKEDESLNKYKESLLGSGKNAKVFDASDPRKVLIRKVEIEILESDRKSIVMNPEGDKPENLHFVLKEDCKYRYKITFAVQHDVVVGLKFLNNVFRLKVRVDKSEEMIGSYSPGQEYTHEFPTEIAPSGMMGRGSYTGKARVIDDDNFVYFEMGYSFDIKKDWKD